MAGVQLFSFVFLLALAAEAAIVLAAGDSRMTPTISITDGQNLTSANQTFQIGFFSLQNSAKKYLGIWYLVDPTIVVWVANRNAPLGNSTSTLNLTADGNLVLYNNASASSTVWSTGTSNARNPVLQLLDSGNLVLTDLADNTTLWQSFDYPCDTSLPGMKLGLLNSQSKTNSIRQLVSWKSASDPSSGDYSYEMETRGVAEFYIRQGPNIKFRTGPWNGHSFSGYPDMPENSPLKYSFVSNQSGIYYTTEEATDGSTLSRAVLNASTGHYERWSWDRSEGGWSRSWSLPIDECDNYAYCGRNSICSAGYSSPSCDCAQGFIRNGSECDREQPLNCHTDEFGLETNVKLPDTVNATADSSNKTVKECRDWCSRNCSCIAYAVVGQNGCVTWSGDLLDLRRFSGSGGDELYVRHSASGHKKLILAITMPLVLGFLLLICLSLLLWWRKRRTKQDFLHTGTESSVKDTCSLLDSSKEKDKDPISMLTALPSYDLSTIKAATNDFSNVNKLGEGGFGVVYKGQLQDGQKIAVKKLSGHSSQGPEEFKNELTLIANLQHRNLVRLLGSCIEGDERILILAYMENKSLDAFIYDKKRSVLLNWHKRLDIIIGIARGLLYLHQDSNLRVIHRDLKPSNILLDKDMNPKISDFGIARMCEGDGFHENATTRPIGTFGYMAPEYLASGIFSFKSDVFSFGVIVLEILSGKRNRVFNQADAQLNLLGHAYKLWKEGRSLEILDDALDCSDPPEEILRCIQMGLLCVQGNSEDRPTMAEVVTMLVSEEKLSTPLEHPNINVVIGEWDLSSSKEISNTISGR